MEPLHLSLERAMFERSNTVGREVHCGFHSPAVHIHTHTTLLSGDLNTSSTYRLFLNFLWPGERIVWSNVQAGPAWKGRCLKSNTEERGSLWTPSIHRHTTLLWSDLYPSSAHRFFLSCSCGPEKGIELSKIQAYPGSSLKKALVWGAALQEPRSLLWARVVCID